ncbi:MAG: hypothetical protein EXR69_07690, partial [Myxococcales bacterium]|nr:hypothetical protein [Myxococcales bacterium]
MSVATLPRALALGLAALAAVAAVGITPRLLTPEAIAQPQPAGGVDWPEITASVTTKSHEVV